MRIKIHKDYSLLVFFILFVLMQIKLQKLRGILALVFLGYYVIKKRTTPMERIKKSPTMLVGFMLVYGLFITAINIIFNNLSDLSYLRDYYLNLFVVSGCSIFLIVDYLNFDAFCVEVRNIGWVMFSFGVLERITRYNITSNYIIEEYRKYLSVYGRIYSIFNHPVGYGAFLAMIAVILMYFPYKKPYVNAIYTILLLLNMVFTGTRSSITALAIILLLILFKKKIIDNKKTLKKITNVKYIVPVISLSVSIIVLLVIFKERIREFSNDYLARFRMGFSGRDQSIRIGVVMNCIKHLKNSNPFSILFGNGIGYADTVFMKNYRILTGYDRSVVWDGTTDNMYITIGLDLGMVGLIGFVLLFVYAGIVFLKANEYENTRAISVSSLLLLLLAIELIVFEGLFWSLCFFQLVLAIAIIGKTPPLRKLQDTVDL